MYLLFAIGNVACGSLVVDTLSKSECLTQSFKYRWLDVIRYVRVCQWRAFARLDIVFALHGTSKDAV